MSMAAMSSSERDRFDAAVKVIQELPKDGTFQPSNEMKARFYGLYKRATAGSCTEPKPAFWDVVKRAKWDAWTAASRLTRDESMRAYVDALKQIVETMSYDDNVQHFLDKVGPLLDEQPTEATDINANRTAPIVVKALENGQARRDECNGDTANLSRAVDMGEQVGESLPNGLPDVQSDDELYADATDHLKPEPQADSVQTVKARDEAEPAAQVASSLVETPATKLMINGERRQSEDRLRQDGELEGAFYQRSVSQIGRSVRDLPLTDPSSGADIDALFEDSWRQVRALQQERVKRDQLHARTQRLLFLGGRRRDGTTRSRGREDSGPSRKDAADTPPPPPPPPSSSGAQPGEREAAATERPTARQHESSGSDSSSGAPSPDAAAVDANVASVLYRMHRELRQISRQLDMMESVLVTQQHLMQSSLGAFVKSQQTRLRLWGLPWRGLVFIVVWPLLVHFVLRICRRRFLRKQ